MGDPFTITMLTLGVVITITSCLAACTSVATCYRNHTKDASSNENTSNVDVENRLVDEVHADGGRRSEKTQKIKIDNYNAGQQFSVTKTVKTGENNEVANKLAGVAATGVGIIPGVGNPIMGMIGPGIAAANAATDNTLKAREALKKDKDKKKHKKSDDEDSSEEYHEKKRDKKPHKKHKTKKEEVELDEVTIDSEDDIVKQPLTKKHKVKEKKVTIATKDTSLETGIQDYDEVDVTILGQNPSHDTSSSSDV